MIQGAFRIAIALCAVAFAIPAQAQLFRAYLSVGGSDANPCTVTQPCRLLPAALAVVADGGEVWMLDSANYNTASVTVGKSVSILAVPGAVGSVLAISGPSIRITASGLKVALSNLMMVPLPGGGGTDGVTMTGTSALTVTHSVIGNMAGRGIHILGAGTLKLAHSTIRDNTYAAVQLTSGGRAEISNTQMLGGGDGGVLAYGTQAGTTTIAVVTDSVISGGFYGVWANTSITGAVAKVTISRSTVESTDRAIFSYAIDGSAVVSMSSTVVTNNANGWWQAGGNAVIRTLGNNHITDNTSTFGVLTPTALH